MILEEPAKCSLCGAGVPSWHGRCDDCQAAIDVEESKRLGRTETDPVRLERTAELAAELGVKASELTLEAVKAARAP